MCAYTGADDLLRVTRHDLPADSLKRRFKTLVKIPRGQQVPELIKDIYTNDQCPPVSFVLFVASNFTSFWMLTLTFIHIPSSSTLWRRKTSAPFFVSLSAATRRRRFRKTMRRKRNRHPARRPLDLRSVPAPKLPALKPELAARPPPRSPRP
jgi:hypothetical protein